MTHAEFVAGARARYRAVAGAFVGSAALITASVAAAAAEAGWLGLGLLVVSVVPLLMMRGLMREADAWMNLYFVQLAAERDRERAELAELARRWGGVA